MSETWHISVGGRSYGPYTLAQMQAFVAEGRLAAHSHVSRTGEDQFRAASERRDRRTEKGSRHVVAAVRTR